MGPKGAGWGAAAPVVGPHRHRAQNAFFGERAPLGFLTWAMTVFYEDTVISFGFWPYSALCLGLDLSGNGPHSFGLV